MRYIITDMSGKIMEQGPMECAPDADKLAAIKKAGYKYKTVNDDKVRT